MKRETVTIQVQRFTDDDGTPIYGKCERIDEGCKKRKIQIKGADFFSFPLSSCPIWRNTVKPKWDSFNQWYDNEGDKVVFDSAAGIDAAEKAWEAARR